MSRKQIFIVAGVAIIVIGLLFLGWERPSRVVNMALKKAGETTTQGFKATIEIENDQTTQQILGEKGTIQLEVDGVFQRNGKEQSSLQSTVNLNVKSESVTVQLSGEMRFINDKAYILITKSPSLFPALAQVKGKWIELPRGGTTQQTADVSTDKLFSHISLKGQEKRDSQSVLKYEAVATQTAVVQMMNTMAELLGTQLTNQQLDSLREGMAQVKDVPLELWITPFSHELQGVKTTLNVPGGNSMHFDLHLKDRNKPVTISVPEGALTADKAFQKP